MEDADAEMADYETADASVPMAPAAFLLYLARRRGGSLGTSRSQLLPLLTV